MAESSERRQSTQEPNEHADVLVELTRITYRHLLPTALLTGIGLAGTTALIANRYHDVWLWIFTGTIAALALARVAMAAAYWAASRSPVTIAGARRWQLLDAVTTLAYCLSTAGCTFYSFRRLDATAWTLCTLGTFMLCAGMAARVGMYPRMMQASGLALLAALALAVLWSADSLEKIGILLIALFGFAYFQSIQSRFEATVDQIRSRRTLSLMSDQDALTGLSKRAHFEATLATTCRLEVPFAILFIDIERLNTVKETHGRAMADVVLQRVGVRLKNSVRRGDTVARIGDDQFAILQTHGASQLSAESLARRILRATATPFEIDGQEIRIATSIWIRLSTAEDRDVRALFDRQHRSLYPVPPPDAPVPEQPETRKMA